MRQKLKWIGLPTFAGESHIVYYQDFKWVLERVEVVGEHVPGRVPEHGPHQFQRFPTLVAALEAAPPVLYPMTLWSCVRFPPLKGGRLDTVRILPFRPPEDTWMLLRLQVDPEGQAHYHDAQFGETLPLLEAVCRAEALLLEPRRKRKLPLCGCLEPVG